MHLLWKEKNHEISTIILHDPYAEYCIRLDIRLPGEKLLSQYEIYYLNISIGAMVVEKSDIPVGI